MALYLITGGSTGIGAAVRNTLQQASHQVLNVDVAAESDIRADLSTADGRQQAAEAIASQAAEGLDGFIPCAGVGPHIDQQIVTAINFFGVLAMWKSAYPLLSKKGGTAVLISSNSAPMEHKHSDFIEALLAEDETEAKKLAAGLDGAAVYAGTKRALVYWMRDHCSRWIAEGVRVNAVAPGMTMTPLVQANFDDPRFSKLMSDFRDSIPAKRAAEPSEIASVIDFLLGPASSYCCGSLFFVDGGFDAMTRPRAC